MIGVWGFDCRRGLEIFLFTACRPALGPTQSPNQWIPRDLSPVVKRPGSEADHSSPSSAEVNNARCCTSTHRTSPWRGDLLSTGTTLLLSYVLTEWYSAGLWVG
jgi:hypothetical protein